MRNQPEGGGLAGVRTKVRMPGSSACGLSSALRQALQPGSHRAGPPGPRPAGQRGRKDINRKQHSPRRRGRPWLLAIGGLLAGLLAGRAAPPTTAGSYPEAGRPVYLGMGGATLAGGSVDAATGAALMPVKLGSILSWAHFPVTA